MYKSYRTYTVFMKREPRSINASDARAELGKLVDSAHYGGEHIVITKGGEPRVVLVPYEWWTTQQAAPE